MLGGVPASLGGGGLEIQIAKTRGALAARGHDVFHVSQHSHARTFDVLHAFSSEPDVWHNLLHWRRNPAPLIVSPVWVMPQGMAEIRQLLASRLPIKATAPRMRIDVLRRAQAVVALTESERRMVTRFAGRLSRVVVIGNGVDPEPTDVETVCGDLPQDYVALVGTISSRKRQQAAVEAVGASGISTVIVGGFEGTATEQARFEDAVSRSGGVWLGEIADPAAVRQVVRRARALVHPSVAEGQSLAILESIAAGTPVVVSPLPSNRELAALYPDYVHFARSLRDVPALLLTLAKPHRPAPIPTWAEVAERLEVLYQSLVF